jgi:CheY-like chemotaxis protein
MNTRNTVLLVEDNEDDVFFLCRALRAAQLDVPVQVASDGQEAMDYLVGKGEFVDRTRFPLPALILLDLKLPHVHGLQTLSWVREQPEIKNVPVFILTSSSEGRDRTKAAELGARGFHVKPPNRELVADVAQILEELRLQAAR